jgi:hypothetical protein
MRNILASLSIIALWACTPVGDSSDSRLSLLDTPARPGAEGPRLTVGANGETTLSWMEPDPDGTTLWYSSLGAGGWSPRMPVVKGRTMFVNWADLPSVLPLGEGRLAAHWLEKVGDLPYSYHVVVAQSFDDGLSWSEGIRVHTDDTPTEHGFVTLFPDSDGVSAIWLDGRKTGSEASDDPMKSGMTLRGARIDRDGLLHDEQEIDPLICDCCQTDVSITESGAVAVYRDRSREEIRDIYATRLIEGQWQAAAPLNRDAWQIAGCPVNGPAIAARGDRVAAAWFSAPGGAAAVQVKFSGDGGASFGKPIEIATGRTLGRADIVMLPDESAVVSWLDASAGGAAELHVRRVGADGTVGDPVAIASGLPARSVPQLALARHSLVLAWSENRDGTLHVVTARLHIDALGI